MIDPPAELGPESSPGMHVLLAAYEFPPSPSPQSLRWAYLCREMAGTTLRMSVVAPRNSEEGHGLPDCGHCRVQRAWPGPFMATLHWLRSLPGVGAGARDETRAAVALQPSHVDGLNWKGRLVERIQRGVGAMMFPDIRAEWNPWARRAVRALLREGGISVLVTSHEPASVLALGREARRAGVAWVADLGDPIAAPYTLPRWRRRALRLERAVCEQADHVTVTTEATRSLLMARHGVDGRKITVVTQGFSAAVVDRTQTHPVAGRSLQLLYTGSLYAFRRIDALLEAIGNVPGVQLAIASRRLPDEVRSWHKRYPDRIRLLGPVTHAHALELQRTADVLVDLGNESPEQVPGKFYEYLGAARPILHIGDDKSEAASELSALRRGWVCAPGEASISRLLRTLVELNARNQLESGLDLGQEAVRGYSWHASAVKMARVLQAVVPVGVLPSPPYRMN